VQTTAADVAVLQTIAKVLVENQLAACVQISGPLESHFIWNERLESSQEFLLTAKTAKDLFPNVQTTIETHHNYEVPEIIAWDIVNLSDRYRQWMLSQIRRPASDGGQ
jgi:periplasmic divalent cation tolerance protein